MSSIKNNEEVKVISFVNFCKLILHLELTKAQLVIAKICFDNLEFRDLTEEDKILAKQIFGHRFDEYFTIPVAARRTLIFRLGRGSGKTTLSAAYALYRTVTCNIDKCGPGDKPTFMVVAPQAKLATIALDMARGLLEQSSFLINHLNSDTKEEIIIKRPTDDKLVSLMTINKSKAGTNMRGRSIIDLLIDESEFMPPEESGKVVTDKDIINGAAPRLIGGGKIILISTPFPTPSFTAEQFEKNYDNPKTSLVALAPTLIMRNNDPEVAENIEIERARDPVNALREYDCVATNATGGFFDCFLIDNAVSKEPIESKTGQTSAGIDLGFSHDCSAQVIVERQGDKIAILNTILLTPLPKQPLKPGEVMSAFASNARSNNCHIMCADQHYYHMVVEYASMRSIAVTAGPRQTEQLYIYLRDLFKEGKIILPNDPILIKQLKSILYKQKANNTGISIILPRGSSSGHTDLVSAFIMALHLDRRFGPVSSNAGQYNPFNKANPNQTSLLKPFQGFMGNGSFERW